MFDKNTLLFVMRNLILIANKFTENGMISVDVRKESGVLALRVSDNGVGMKSEQVMQLFDWGKRHSTPGTQGERGAGLALLLGYDLLRKSGADLRVESHEGIGSTFSVLLPLESL